MIDVKSQQSCDTDVLKLSGELTLENAADLKAALMNALNNFNHVLIDVEEVSEIDLACLQLFCSAHRTSVKMNKTLVLAGAYPDSLKKAVQDSGFARHIGCVLNPNKNCLWAVVCGA